MEYPKWLVKTFIAGVGIVVLGAILLFASNFASSIAFVSGTCLIAYSVLTGEDIDQNR